MATVWCAAFAAAAWFGQLDQGFGEAAKAEVDGFAIQAKARLMPSTSFVNGKQVERHYLHLSLSAEPKATGEGAKKRTFGIAQGLKLTGVPEGEERNNFAAMAGMRNAGGPPMLGEDHSARIMARMAAMRAGGRPDAEDAATGPRHFMHQVMLPAGDPPKELATLEGELLVAELGETEYVFASGDLAPGTDMKQQGVKLRLYCFDVDEELVAVGVRFRGTAEKLGGLMRSFQGTSSGPPLRWSLELADGTKLPSQSSGATGGGSQNGEMVYRMTTEFRNPSGKKPKSLTLTSTTVQGEWQRIPFKLEKIALPAPAARGGRVRAALVAPVAAPAAKELPRP